MRPSHRQSAVQVYLIIIIAFLFMIGILIYVYPDFQFFFVVPETGFEPATPSLRMRCSTN